MRTARRSARSLLSPAKTGRSIAGSVSLNAKTAAAKARKIKGELKLRQNFRLNKKRREEAKKKKREAKRNKRLDENLSALSSEASPEAIS